MLIRNGRERAAADPEKRRSTAMIGPCAIGGVAFFQ
jgi:hypothetical protein